MTYQPDGTQYFAYDYRNLAEFVRYKDESWQYFYHESQMRMYAMNDGGAMTYFTWDRICVYPRLPAKASLAQAGDSRVT